MNSEDQGTRFLIEFKEFISFLKKLWGMLAALSTLFPLSNVFLKIIPLGHFNGGALVWLSPELFTGIATLVSLFLILWTFGNRYRYRLFENRARTQMQAGLIFSFGILSLIVYLVTYYFIANSAFEVLGWESEDTRRLLGEVVLLLFYSAFFALVTRAFVLLGMIEFFARAD